MQYQDYDVTTESETTTWSATPASSQTRLVPASQNGQLVAAPATATRTITSPPHTHLPDAAAIGNLIQSVQQTQAQQVYLLRDLDLRLARLEQGAQTAQVYVAPSFERATWWALWGLLMLILGGALAIITMLILLNIEIR